MPTPNAQVSATPAAPVATNNPASAVPSDPKSQVKAVVDATKAPAPVEDAWEVQIDGKPVKKTKKEILEAYQLRQLSDKKRSEADRVLAEYKKLQDVSKQDPIKFMKAMGYDFDGLATQYLARKAEDAMKDPKQLELETAKAEAAQYKKWVEEQKAAQDAQKKQASVQAERQRIHQEIIEAIEEKKELGLPVDEHLIIQIAQDMMVQDKAKKPLNAKEALPATYARTQKWLQGLASKMEGEALVSWLGKDVANKIRKYDLASLKAKRSAVAPAAGSAVKPMAEIKSKPARPYQTWSEFKASKLDTLK